MNIIKDWSEIFSRLRELAGRRVLILGIGNSLKADDGVGPYICSKISSKVSVMVINAGVALENFTGLMTRYDPEVMLFLDVIDTGDEPGTLCLIPLEETQSFALSTHSLSPHLVVNNVSQDSRRCGYIVGIQPKNLTLGEPISDEVAHQADKLADELIEIFSEK
jgi:hydrogenase 3 maturation protease